MSMVLSLHDAHALLSVSVICSRMAYYLNPRAQQCGWIVWSEPLNRGRWN